MQASKTLAALLAVAALGTANAQTTFFEGFDDVEALPQSGWDIWNLSQEPNPWYGWFQGYAGELEDPAHETFAASNYLSTVRGTLSVWLVTPEITLSGNDVLGFSVATVGPWADGLRVHIGDGSATTAADFGTTILDIPSMPDTWVDFQPSLPQIGKTVRIAFEYYGSFVASNYLGLDSVSVTSAVPEPGAAALFALGLAGIALHRLRRPAAQRV